MIDFLFLFEHDVFITSVKVFMISNAYCHCFDGIALR